MTKAAFSRYGFAYADLLIQWPAIAGKEIAAISEPERIRWPRQGEDKRGGTLILKAAPGRALDLQHQVARIAERINGFYGYAAIVQIKVVQSPLKPVKAAPRSAVLDAGKARALDERLDFIADPALKTALRRLGAGALSHARPPQGK